MERHTTCGEPGSPFGGSAAARPVAAQADPFAFLLGMTRPGVYSTHFETPYGDTYFFNHPDFIKEILKDPSIVRTRMITRLFGNGLLASDGDHWRCQRRIMQRGIQPASLANVSRVVQVHVDATVARWEQLSAEGRTFNVFSEMVRLTLVIVLEAFFSATIDEKLDKLSSSLGVLVEWFGDVACTQLNIPLVITPRYRERFLAALEVVDDVALDVIRAGTTNTRREDLLQILREAECTHGGRPLTERQLRDEFVTMMIAGHETTAVILSWAWYLLSQHPDVEARLHAELDDVLGQELPGMRELEKLTYTQMVVEESMRLYPPVWVIVRKTLAEKRVGDSVLPENTAVVVSPYAMHRHPDFWDNPERFDPERFAPERITAAQRGAFLPFGAGRHLCLGKEVAMLEAKLILAGLAQRFRVRPVPGQSVAPMPAITLRARNGIQVGLTRRGHSSGTA